MMFLPYTIYVWNQEIIETQNYWCEWKNVCVPSVNVEDFLKYIYNLIDYVLCKHPYFLQQSTISAQLLADIWP